MGNQESQEAIKESSKVTEVDKQREEKARRFDRFVSRFESVSPRGRRDGEISPRERRDCKMSPRGYRAGEEKKPDTSSDDDDVSDDDDYDSVTITNLTLGPRLQQRLGVQCMEMAEIERLQANAATPVTLNIYSVGQSEALELMNQVVQDYLKVGGVFHGAIQILDHEWSFAWCPHDDGPGIFCNEPCKCYMHTYRQSIYLGDCKKMPSQVELILRDMLPDWSGSSYSLLRKNCCSFCDAFSRRLGVGQIPDWVHRLADTGAALDDDAKLALQALHQVEASVVEHAQSVMSMLSQQEGDFPIDEGNQLSCCCTR